MRLLLKDRAGATSFTDLRTIHGIVYATFKKASVAAGLCDDDHCWLTAMSEACMFEMPIQLRHLFCSILINCHPTSPLTLFHQFADAMSTDFFHHYQRQAQIDSRLEECYILLAHNDLLLALREIFMQHGLNLHDFHLEEPNQNIHTDMNRDNNQDSINSSRQFFDENKELLNEEQRLIFQTIQERIDSLSGGLFNIDACGGCGKTFLCNIILAYVRMQNKIALAAAMSGIAATLLKSGTTFHKRFGVPINCTDTSTSSIKLDSSEAQIIKQATIIFVDEVSMMSWKQLLLLDRLLQNLMQNSHAMGGKLVVLMHDFRQLLPVVPGGSRANIVAESVICSELWSAFTPLTMVKNMRVEKLISTHANDAIQAQYLTKYADWLLSVGNGATKVSIPGTEIIQLPNNMKCNSLQELENKVFDNFLNNYTNTTYLANRAIMSCTNDTIQKCNQDLVDLLPGEEMTSYSVHAFQEENDNARHDVGMLNRIKSSGLPPHKLTLKKGVCIILIRNLDIARGHCNGTRYIILGMKPFVLRAQKLHGDNNPENDDIFIHRIPMPSGERDYPVPFTRMQFPVLVSYYLTITRAQGQSLTRAGLYLPRNVFSHGHLYVALSRCGNPNAMFVYSNHTQFDHLCDWLSENEIFAKNIVYKEVLIKR